MEHVAPTSFWCRRSQPQAQSNTKTPVFLAVGVAVAGFMWWKWRQHRKPDEKTSGRSPFKFPAVSGTTAASSSAASQTNLPRHKTSNNKKNKARKQAEKQRRAEKKEK